MKSVLQNCPAARTSFWPAHCIQHVIQGESSLITLMTYRLSHEALVSLRATLHRLEESEDSYQDAASLAKLKQILLNRIAELEAGLARETPGSGIHEPTSIKNHR